MKEALLRQIEEKQRKKEEDKMKEEMIQAKYEARYGGGGAPGAGAES